MKTEVRNYTSCAFVYNCAEFQTVWFLS